MGYNLVMKPVKFISELLMATKFFRYKYLVWNIQATDKNKFNFLKSNNTESVSGLDSEIIWLQRDL